MGKMVKRKSFKKRLGARSKVKNYNRQAYGEKFHKKVTTLINVATNGNGQAYLVDGLSGINLINKLVTTSFFINSVMNGAVANYQRLRVSGVALEYMPNELFLTTANQLTSLPPLALSLYADYTNTGDVPDAFSVLDQRDRFLLLPQQTSRPQRKYWAFPKTAISFGKGQRGYPLGSYIDVPQLVVDYGGNVAYPGLLEVTTVNAFNGGPFNLTVGTIIVDFYIDLDKPTR